MKGKFEGMRLYQTLAEPGEDYPALPDPSTEMATVNSVWYVKELANASFDPADAVPEITATDTGKRFYAFNMGNGAVLDDLALSRGMSRTYLREGTYLAGFWQNGQLFVIPIMEGYGCRRCDKLRIQKGMQWKVTVPAVDDYWVRTNESEHTLTDGIFSMENELDAVNATVVSHSHLYGGRDASEADNIRPDTGANYCKAGNIDYDNSYVFLGDGALSYFESHPDYGTPGSIFEGPWADGYNYLSVHLRHRSIYREVLVSVCVNRADRSSEPWFGGYVFTALYQSEYRKCVFSGPQTFTRSGAVAVVRQDGTQVNVPPFSFETNITTEAADQLPTSVTVEQV